MAKARKKTGKPGGDAMSTLEFFGVATDRMDRWNEFNNLATRLGRAQQSGASTEKLIAAMKPVMEQREVYESYWAYPGNDLLNEVTALFHKGDYPVTKSETESFH